MAELRTGEELVASWPDRHPHVSTCPHCGKSAMTVGIVDLVYTFEKCPCFAAEYVHLAERLWHRECFAAAVTGSAFLEQLTYRMRDTVIDVAQDNPYDGRTSPGRAWRNAARQVEHRLRAELERLTAAATTESVSTDG